MSRRGVKKTATKAAPVFKGKKALENTATLGLILVAVGMLAPFADMSSPGLIRVFKWIYTAGAAVFTIARAAGSTDHAESMQIRRLRRLEFWAGVAFCIGAFFWFYNENRFSFYLDLGMGTLACLRDTIYFTLAGAAIQILAVVMLSRRMKREGEGRK